jgi:hypothetical protein
MDPELGIEPKIILTDHVRQRAVDRGIDENEIVRIVKKPVESIYDTANSNYKSYGISTDPYTKQTRYLMVVHTGKINNSIKVITSMWVYPSRLKIYGFNKV